MKNGADEVGQWRMEALDGMGCQQHGALHCSYSWLDMPGWWHRRMPGWWHVHDMKHGGGVQQRQQRQRQWPRRWRHGYD